MKRLTLTALFLFLSVVIALPSTIEVNFDFQKPFIERKGEYHIVKIDGLLNFGNPGEPILPIKTAKILIPQSEAIEDVMAIPYQKTYIKGHYLVHPGQRPIPLIPLK